MRAHLYKLQAMHEDLMSMGGIIDDEDFMSVILGSIPQSYNTYIAERAWFGNRSSEDEYSNSSDSVS